MEFILDQLKSYSPGLLIGVGVALLIVPQWLRIVMAFGLILAGVMQLYPDLFTSVTPPPDTSNAQGT
ncbi:MAG: hypothetical protein AAGM04_03730 [Pseudomonadota bacterium]